MTIQPDKVTAQDTWMYTAKADVGRSVGIGIGGDGCTYFHEDNPGNKS